MNYRTENEPRIEDRDVRAGLERSDWDRRVEADTRRKLDAEHRAECERMDRIERQTVALFVFAIALFVFFQLSGCAAPTTCPTPIPVEGPKPIDSFIACDTFDDFVARNAERWGCGESLPECPWLRALDVRCDPAEVLESIDAAREVATCAEVVPMIDGGACL